MKNDHSRELFLGALAVVALATAHLLGALPTETLELAVIGGVLSLVVWSVGGVGVSLLSVILAHRARAERPREQVRRAAHLENYNVRTERRGQRVTV